MPAALSDDVLGSPRFEPLRVLGEGGSGIVYEVRVRSGPKLDSQTLALKVLRAELAPSERERRRFLAEAERMQRLHAPGLVSLLESGVLPDGRPYLAMPLLDGETLAEKLKRGPLPVSVAMRYFDVLSSAVDALHASGMVHRDIKPENIIVVNDAPVLLDFGIARDIEEVTTTTTSEGRVRGTPAYMAPERFFGAPASIRSDVYELGIVLYMMLVGRLPWGTEANATERLNPQNPREAGAHIAKTVATVIVRALSTRPEIRPETARQFAEEVASAADESGAPSHRTLEVAIEPKEDVSPSSVTTGRGLPHSSFPSNPNARASRSRSQLLGIGVTAMASALAIAAAYGWRRGPPATEGTPRYAPSTLFVAPSMSTVVVDAGSALTPVASAAMTGQTAMTATQRAAVSPRATASGARVRSPALATASAPAPTSADLGRYFEDRN